MNNTTQILTAILMMIFTQLSFSFDQYEPPQNPWLADSAWPMTHRNPYQQASSPHPGPKRSWDLRNADYQSTHALNITLAMSPTYPDGEQVYWGSSLGWVYKLQANKKGLKKLQEKQKPNGFNMSSARNAVSGAYCLVDFENQFYAVDNATILVYGDSVPGESASPIRLIRQYSIPEDILRGGPEIDPIVGLNMTYDGHLVFATKQGTVGLIDRDLTQAHYITLGDEEEEISNSIATDEDGGIFVISEKSLYRFQWTGSELSNDPALGAWKSDYEKIPDDSGNIRLGSGSGSTPTLMGTGNMDKFVVITDARKLTHITLYWRNEIPEDWTPIAAGKDPRIAAELPVNFGDDERVATMSEQSVVVRGFGALVVSNDYRNLDSLTNSGTGNDILDNIKNGVVAAFSHFPKIKPYGMHKFEWNPESRELESSWVNTDVSCPNGVPTMSALSNLAYCYGAKKLAWTIEGVDWDSGESVFSKIISWNFFHNSFYAALQIGNNGTMVSGTSLGAIKLDPR